MQGINIKRCDWYDSELDSYAARPFTSPKKCFQPTTLTSTYCTVLNLIQETSECKYLSVIRLSIRTGLHFSTDKRRERPEVK